MTISLISNNNVSHSFKVPNMGGLGKSIVHKIISCIRPLFCLIEFFIDRKRTRCFGLDSLSRRVTVGNPIHGSGDTLQKIKSLYDGFCEIHRNQAHGFGTCYVRSFFAAKALLTGKDHTYAHTLRATVDPVDFARHFQSDVRCVREKAFDDLADGTVLVFIRPLTDKFSRFFNYSLENTQGQLSHMCSGVVLNGRVYVIEVSQGKLSSKTPISSTILEPLEDFQKRMDKGNVPRLNQFVPVGQLHSSFRLQEKASLQDAV